MRTRGLFAAGALCAGLACQGAFAQMGEWKLGAGGATAAANLGQYNMGVGASVSIASERQAGALDSRVGIRGHYLNYLNENDDLGRGEDFQQYNIGLETLIGPAMGIFEPKVGGHVGYVRLDNELPGQDDNLDLGADVMASFNILPNLEIQALVSPTWLMNEDDMDYQTRGSLGVEFALPGV